SEQIKEREQHVTRKRYREKQHQRVKFLVRQRIHPESFYTSPLKFLTRDDK
ncbi:unnamed protein product, partial [marine sediment metagenome]